MSKFKEEVSIPRWLYWLFIISFTLNVIEDILRLI